MESDKDKKINVPRMSLRAFITITLIVASMGVLFFYAFGTNKMYFEKYKQELILQINEQGNLLISSIKDTDVIFGNLSELANQIDDTASFFDGRVMVISADYYIVYDSFNANNNSIIVDENIIKIINGKNNQKMIEKNGYIQYMAPISKNDVIVGAILINASTSRLNSLFGLEIGRKNVLFIVIIFFVCLAMSNMIGLASVRGIKFINRRMQVAMDGHLDEKIPVKGFKEFRALTESYNDTIAKLMDIDSTRQEFVSNVSHELKTPITSMKVLADSIVQNEEADLPMYKEFMADIVEELDRETEIINDLLTLVKTDKSSADMNIADTNINSLLEIILKRVTPIAKNRSIEITYESYRDVVAQVDEVKLGLAISNIIVNAVKYNVDNGWVKVTLNADHKYFHIKVADSGVGIPDDCKDKVFERFYRVDKARSRDTGGTGLGLAITRNIILLHNGTIKLYSESGEGTTFTIKIPINYVEN